MYIKIKNNIIREFEQKDTENLFSVVCDKKILRFIPDWKGERKSSSEYYGFIDWSQEQKDSTDIYANKSYIILTFIHYYGIIEKNVKRSRNMEIDNQQRSSTADTATKFCKYCGEKIDKDAVICIKCGKQVEELKNAGSQPNIIINNTNTNTNTNTNINAGMLKKAKNKWVAVLLCLFLGYLGAHKFYEGKIGLGILYLFTIGLLGFGVLIDLIVLLFKPNPYYV